MKITLWRRLALLALVVCSLIAVGCGGSDDSNSSSGSGSEASADAEKPAEQNCKDGDRSVEDSLQAFTERRYPRARFSQMSSRAILDAEASVTAETLDIAIEHMRAELPGKFREIDAVFSQPA